MFFQRSAAIIPRGIRTDYNLECSCSNSCEKVLELLITNDEKITFEENQLAFNFSIKNNSLSNELKLIRNGIRDICNSVIVNRDLSLTSRLILIGKVLFNIQKPLNENQPINFELIINESLKNIIILNDISTSIAIQEKLISYFSKRSPSIQIYAAEANKYYHQQDKVNQYLNAKKHLTDILPNSEIMFEKVIHNYMIFEQFPFSKQSHSLTDEFKSLCGVYLFIKYLAAGYMAERSSINDFVDVLSASFRIINHTDFNQIIDIIFSNENINTFEQIAVLIQD